jgi:DNA helicase-2/ATP-dependent DNA helicase PcrA
VTELLEGLNAQQREAVLATEGPVLILAGAGSGKTRVITHRLAHLVRDKGVPARALLAVTFTNKAAGEMKARAEALLGGGEIESWICTFHSFCVRVLRRHAAEAGIDHAFLIWDEDDQMEAVRQALRALELPEKLYPPRRLLSAISAAKNAGRRPGEAGTEGDGSPWQETVSRVGQRYEALLQASRALDFDDLLLKAAALLEGDERVRGIWRARFQYVLVDEYQDTNRVQYALIRSLVGPDGNVTVVGDEDQSIYSWRGADINNILDFERDFPRARVLRLEENYRSTQAILDAASAVVAHNRQRKGKTLRATRSGGEPVRLHQAADEFHEASWVVGQVGRLPRGQRAAVLYRMNSQSRLFEEALMRQGLAYTVVGGVGFYERREVKDMLAYLRLVLNPDDSMALRRVINVPARGIGERTLELLQALAAQGTTSLWQAVARADDEDLLPARATVPLRRFRALVEQLRAEAGGLTVKGLVERALQVTGYAAALAQEDSHESQDRLENLAELLSAAADFDAREAAPTLAEFLDRVSLLSETDLMRSDAPVVLMTLHSAKGLEFDAIFLAGLEEGLIPHSRSQDSRDGLEEERRLCYVGMTRARQRLSLTWAKSRRVFGQRRPSEPSRFLFEVPRPGLVVTADEDYAAAAPAERPSWRRAQREPEDVVAPTAGELDELRPGMKVRHPLFGEGTVVQSEGTGLDKKLTVSFRGIGAKRLVARYAALEVL